jgi:hypothetical protein
MVDALQRIIASGDKEHDSQQEEVTGDAWWDAVVRRITNSRDKKQEPQQEQEEVSGVAWWEAELWDNMLYYQLDELDFLASSLEELTDGKPLAAVPGMAIKALACQLRAKAAAGNKRVAVSGRGTVGIAVAAAAACRCRSALKMAAHHCWHSVGRSCMLQCAVGLCSEGHAVWSRLQPANATCITHVADVPSTSTLLVSVVGTQLCGV